MNLGISSANGIQPVGGVTPGGEQSVKPKQDETPLTRNAAALKYLTHGMPNVLAPFFQGLSRYMYHILDIFYTSFQCTLHRTCHSQEVHINNLRWLV